MLDLQQTSVGYFGYSIVKATQMPTIVYLQLGRSSNSGKIGGTVHREAKKSWPCCQVLQLCFLTSRRSFQKPSYTIYDSAHTIFRGLPSPRLSLRREDINLVNCINYISYILSWQANNVCLPCTSI